MVPAAVVRLQAQAQQAGGASELRVLPVRGNIFLLSGAGANITVSVGKDGVLLVDSGSAAMAEKTLAAIRDLSRRVTASPGPLKSCVGVVQGLPVVEQLRAAAGDHQPAGAPADQRHRQHSDDADDIGGNAVIGAAGRTLACVISDNSIPGAAVIAHENAALR